MKEGIISHLRLINKLINNNISSFIPTTSINCSISLILLGIYDKAFVSGEVDRGFSILNLIMWIRPQVLSNEGFYVLQLLLNSMTCIIPGFYIRLELVYCAQTNNILTYVTFFLIKIDIKFLFLHYIGLSSNVHERKRNLFINA